MWSTRWMAPRMLNDLDASLHLVLGILAGVGTLLCLLTYHESASTEGTEDPR